MAAGTLVAPRRFDVRETAVPTPRPREVLVRLEGCGVCASNLSPWQGQPWFTYPMAPGALGHEGWGRVEAVGAQVSECAPGDRVAMLSEHAFARYDVADAGSVLRLPASLDGQAFPGEPLGCAMNIIRRSGIQPGDTVAIVGLGFLGALLTQLAAGAGALVIGLARRRFSREVAAGMGAEHTLSLDDQHAVIEEIRELTGGRFCDAVIEATGQQAPLDLAGEITRERGRLIVAGYHQDGPRQVNMQLWNWRGLDVINAHERDPQVYLAGMRAAVAAVESGRLTPSPLYTHEYPLEQLGEALAMSAERPSGFMKALISL